MDSTGPHGVLKVLAAPAHYALEETFGSERYWAAAIVQAVARQGVDVTALTGTSSLPALPGATIEQLWSSEPDLGYARRLEFVGRYTVAGLRHLREVDVVHHILPFALGWTFNPLVLAGRRPSIVGPVQTLHGGDLSDEGPEARLFAGPKKPGPEEALFRRLGGVAGWLSRKTLQRADVVVAVSEAAERACREIVPASDVRVIPPGVDTAHFSPETKATQPREGVLAVGSLVRRKQFDLLVQAMAVLRDRGAHGHLTIVGDGPERPRLEELARRLRVSDRVVFAGLVANRDTPAFYRRAAVVALVSRAEAAATVPLEAMACGTPVVATRVGLMAELLRDHEVGLAVEADVRAIAEALEAVLGNSSLRTALGDRGRRLMEDRHDWAYIGRRYVDLYEEVTARAATSR